MPCCGRCRRPRHQRLVDALFSQENEGQIDQAHLARLLFYAHSSPDKLGRVGSHLNAKLKRFVRTNRTVYAHVCMEAARALLAQCDTRTLSLLVRPTLAMLHTLLESSNAQFHSMAADTFLAFKDLPEEHPLYQPEYDFIIERFTQLALPQNSHEQVRGKCLACLSGVIEKVQRDRLVQVNIWDEVHLNLLVPAFLYRIKEEGGSGDHMTAFVKAASITQLAPLMAAIFEHCDNNHCWIGDSKFVMTLMENVVKATEVQLQHLVLEALLRHLAKHGMNALISTAIIQVLGRLVPMAADSIAGPYLLDFLRTLVSHLKTNISRAQSSSENKAALEKFETDLLAVIVTCGVSVPSYERWNIVCFLLHELPEAVAVQTESVSVTLSVRLIQCCQKVVQSLAPQSLDDTFSDHVFSAMKRLWKLQDPDLLPLVLQLWTQALDTNKNAANLPLSVEWSSLETAGLRSVTHRQYIFNTKYLKDFLQDLSDVIALLPWERIHMETYYRLLVTLPLSLGAEAGHSLVAAGMELQDGTHLGKSGCGQFAHVCVSGLLHCLSVVVGGGASWCEHVDDIIHCRRSVGRHLLPEGFFLESGVLNVVGEAQGAAGREERVLFKASEIRLQGPPSLVRLPSVSMYEPAERTESISARSIMLLSSPTGLDEQVFSYSDLRVAQSVEDSGGSAATDQQLSFQEAFSKEASFVHQQIANMLTSSIMSGEEYEGEAIELPEIH